MKQVSSKSVIANCRDSGGRGLFVALNFCEIHSDNTVTELSAYRETTKGVGQLL